MNRQRLVFALGLILVAAVAFGLFAAVVMVGGWGAVP